MDRENIRTRTMELPLDIDEMKKGSSQEGEEIDAKSHQISEGYYDVVEESLCLSAIQEGSRNNRINLYCAIIEKQVGEIDEIIFDQGKKSVVHRMGPLDTTDSNFTFPESLGRQRLYILILMPFIKQDGFYAIREKLFLSVQTVAVTMATGCCGCSLHGVTITAAVFSMFQSIFGLLWNVQLLMTFNGNESLYYWRILVNVTILDDYDVVHGLTLASLGLHVLWLISVIMLLRGNSNLTRGMLTPWVLITYLLTLFDIGTTVYFAIKFQSAASENIQFFDSSKGEGTKTLTYCTLLVVFSRGCFAWFINVLLAHFVEKRGKEIAYDNAMLSLYILSHLSHQKDQDQVVMFPEPPPSYFPDYLPPHLLEEARDQRGSSWSLSQDTLRGLREYENSAAFTNPLYAQHHLPRVCTSPGDLHQLAINCGQSSSGVLPY